MLQLLMHHVGRTDLTGISNCHVRGLHSVMLHDQDGNRIRVYCTTDGVDTNYNFIPTDEYIVNEYSYSADNIQRIEMARQSSCSGMSLGLHGHGTDVRLEVLAGGMYNITADVERNAHGGMRRYLYSSRITGDGTIRLAAGERWRAMNIVQTRMRQGDNIYLEANKLHTVYIDGFCSWLVYERGPRSNMDSHFFSYNTNAHRSDMEGMYTPMSPEECQALLARVIAAYQQSADQAQRQAAQARLIQENKDRLISCKAAVESARLITPSTARRYGRPSDLRQMTAATGALRPSSVIRLLSNSEWERWLNYVERTPDGEGLLATSFFEWASMILDQRSRSIVAEPAALAVTDSPEPEILRPASFAEEVERYRQSLDEVQFRVLDSMSAPAFPTPTTSRRRTTATSGLPMNSLSATAERALATNPFTLRNTSVSYTDRPELP